MRQMFVASWYKSEQAVSTHVPSWNVAVLRNICGRPEMITSWSCWKMKN